MDEQTKKYLGLENVDAKVISEGTEIAKQIKARTDLTEERLNKLLTIRISKQNNQSTLYKGYTLGEVEEVSSEGDLIICIDIDRDYNELICVCKRERLHLHDEDDFYYDDDGKLVYVDYGDECTEEEKEELLKETYIATTNYTNKVFKQQRGENYIR